MTQSEILALPASSSENRMIYATDTKVYLAIPKDQPGSAATVLLTAAAAPYDLGSSSFGTLNLDVVNGFFQKVLLEGSTEPRTVNVSTVGATEGMYLTVRIENNISSASRTLSFHASVSIPSDSGLSFPKSLVNDKVYIVKLYFNGSAWELISLVGGY